MKNKTDMTRKEIAILRKSKPNLTKNQIDEIIELKNWERAKAASDDKSFKKFMYEWNHGINRDQPDIHYEVMLNGVGAVAIPSQSEPFLDNPIYEMFTIIEQSIPKFAKPKEKVRPDTLSQAKQDFLYAVDRSQCVCILCGHKITKRKHCTIEHGHSLVNGGTNDRENLFPAHGKCNSLKGSNNLEISEKYSLDENAEILETAFQDIHGSNHFITFKFYIESGLTVVNSIVTNRHKKVVETFLKYNKSLCLEKEHTTKQSGKMRYYNHNAMMYGRYGKIK